MYLHDRLVKTGTLSHPQGIKEPKYTLPATVNWMRALAFIVDHHDIRFKTAKEFYSPVSRYMKIVEHQENSIFEHLLFSIHQVSALQALQSIPKQADVARIGILTWYYGIYSAASAMVIAQQGSCSENHTDTANEWYQQIVARGCVMKPFHYHVTTLLEPPVSQELDAMRKGYTGNLDHPPKTLSEACGACIAYLSGNVSWWQEKAKKNVRDNKDFRALGVTDFKTKKARALRDKNFAKSKIGFLHQAYRYRGKANYREALYLGYENPSGNISDRYIEDLSTVLDAFVSAAGAFCARRIGAQAWKEFVDDLDKHRLFSVSPKELWS